MKERRKAHRGKGKFITQQGTKTTSAAKSQVSFTARLGMHTKLKTLGFSSHTVNMVSSHHIHRHPLLSHNTDQKIENFASFTLLQTGLYMLARKDRWIFSTTFFIILSCPLPIHVI